MSEIKVNKISPATSTDITLGDSGDTFTLPSGATFVNSGTATGFGGGKVLQAVAAIDVTNRSTTSTTFVTIAGMPSVDITPASTSNKVLLLASFCHGENTTGEGDITIFRDSTNVATGSKPCFSTMQETGKRFSMGGAAFLDSPSLDVQITYAIYIRSGGTYLYNGSAGTVSLVAMEIGA